MLPSGLWLHLTVGFVFGMFTTVFGFIVRDSLIHKKSFLKLIGYLVLFSSAFALISYSYGYVIYRGILQSWIFWGRPNSEKVVEVLDIGYVQTESGNIYRLSCLECRNADWERVNNIVTDPDQIRLSLDDCVALPFLPLLRKDFVDSKKACIVSGSHMGTAKWVFAADKYGNIYSWRFAIGDLVGMAEELRFSIVGGELGLIVGVIVILLMVLKIFGKKTKTRVVQSRLE
jgi:hypothetical protein